MDYKNIVKDFNWLKKYSGYPEKCGTLEPIIRKAIPYKPADQRITHNATTTGVCRCRLVVNELYNYCPDCGQALDWCNT